MAEEPKAFPHQRLSISLRSNSQQYQDILLFFDDYQFDLDSTNQRLCRLAELLLESHTLLADLFSDDVSVSQLLPYFDWIQEGRSEFYQLFNGIKTIEKVLLHLMEIIEEEFGCNEDEQFQKELTGLFDLLEEISDKLVSIKPIISSLKNLFDTAIEFNEIFKDHMNSLDEEIENNLSKCIELEEQNFESPVRHNKPTFTLDQLIKTLSSTNSPTKGLQIPAFSPLEQKIHEKLTQLEDSSAPIDLSLKHVLSERLNNFETRDVVNLEYLMRLLRKKYQYILDKYELLQVELRDLKQAIVDEKWVLIFTTLNDELRIMLKDVEKLLLKVGNPDLSEQLKTKLHDQLRSKSYTIDKTFGIIYNALESSILNESIATVTNEHAEKWLQFNTKFEHLLPEHQNENDPNKNITQLSNDISELRLNDAPSEKPGSNRSSIGAILFKKMNIKPVLVREGDENDSNSDNVKCDRHRYSNPFFDPCQATNLSPKKVLNFNKVPSLSFEQQLSIVETIESRAYDINRLKQYGQLPTRIPRLPFQTQKNIPHRTILFNFDANWAKKHNHQLKFPVSYVS
ncbi:Kar9 [Kluyveromyces lactis]|nr:Kar9 [Kluyveromyces lactis]